jgi:transaldolase
MSESYFLAVKRHTPSRLWVNNPTLAEIGLALAQGATGCTTNPGYASGLLKRAPEEARPVIAEAMREAGDPRAAAHIVQRRLVARIAEWFRPLYDETAGREGYVSIQGAPDEDDDGDRILEQGYEGKAIGPNIAVKIPASLPGFFAFERLVAGGTPTIITEVFSLAQLVYACETYLRVTREAGVRPPFMVSPITGIFADHLKAVGARDGIACDSQTVDWIGVILGRTCQAVVEARNYPVRLLFGGARLPIDFTGLVGGRSAATLNYSTVEQILALDPAVEDTIHQPAQPAIVAELSAKFQDVARGLAIDGLDPEEFEEFGPVLHFRNNFLANWQAAVAACAAAGETAPAGA